MAAQPSLTSRAAPCRDVAHDIHPESVLQVHAIGDDRGPDELGAEDRVRRGKSWHRCQRGRRGRPEAKPAEGLGVGGGDRVRDRHHHVGKEEMLLGAGRCQRQGPHPRELSPVPTGTEPHLPLPAAPQTPNREQFPGDRHGQPSLQLAIQQLHQHEHHPGHDRSDHSASHGLGQLLADLQHCLRGGGVTASTRGHGAQPPPSLLPPSLT